MPAPKTPPTPRPADLETLATSFGRHLDATRSPRTKALYLDVEDRWITDVEVEAVAAMAQGWV